MKGSWRVRRNWLRATLFALLIITPTTKLSALSQTDLILTKSQSDNLAEYIRQCEIRRAQGEPVIKDDHKGSFLYGLLTGMVIVYVFEQERK